MVAAVVGWQLSHRNPLGKFDFRHPNEWPKWKRHFTQYLAATGLESEGDARKVSTLLYTMGDEGDDVLTPTNITTAGRKKYDTVHSKFDSFFDVRKNVIYERAKFNQRNQKEGETAKQYITTLYRLVETCDYDGLKDEMLRDRLVVGIKDKTMSQKLQTKADLTLESAKKEILQKEAMQQQQQELEDGANAAKRGTSLEEVTGKYKPPQRYRRKGGHNHKPPPHKGGASVPKTTQACMRCGKPYHQSPDKCPALSATCFKCHRKGHYGSVCRSNTALEVQASSDEEEIFLGAVTSNKDSAWTVNLLLQQKEVQFKMDTGVEVTVISDKVYQTLENIDLNKPTKALNGPACQRLDVMRQFTGILSHSVHSHSERIFVVRDLQNNLLGLQSIIALNLIQRIDVTHQPTTIQEQFPNVFNRLGTMGGWIYHQVEGRDTAILALHTKTSPLCSEEASPRGAHLHGVNGRYIKGVRPHSVVCGHGGGAEEKRFRRICVDLKPLSESMLREVHPIPRVDEALAQLAGATVFSKIDANCGFWQIPLSPESRPLTAFVTQFGQYCFNKLPLGISSAPELFQRRMHTILEGLEGVTGLIDDTLIYGKDKAEDDARLVKVMERLEAATTVRSACSKLAVNFLSASAIYNNISLER